MAASKPKFVRLRPEYHQQLKQIAAETNRPIQALVQLAVAGFLKRPARGVTARK